MKRRHPPCIACLDDRGLTLYQQQAHDWRALHHFLPTAAAELNAHLPEGSALYLLANSAELEFQRESLPPAKGRDQRLLLARRLQQRYPNTPYRCALPLGIHNGQLQVLLCAVPDPASIERWTTPLLAAHRPILGLGALPLLSASLARQLKLPAGQHLLLTAHPGGQLRISHLHGQPGQFALGFSRQISRPGPLDDIARQEAERTRQYLISQGQLDHESILHTHLLLPKTPNPDDAPPADPQQPLHQYPLTAPDTLADLLFLQLAQAAGLPDHLGNAELRHTTRMQQRNRYITLTACLLTAGNLGAAAYWQQDCATQQAILSERQASRPLPIGGSPLPPMTHALLATAQRWQQQLGTPPSQQQLLAVLSQSLATSPELQLELINWQYRRLETADKPPRPSGTLSVQGHLTPTLERATAEQQLAAIQQALRQAGHRVTLREGPQPQDPAATLSGPGDTTPAAPEPTPVHLSIEWAPP